MKASTIKAFTKVHTWTGLGTGMALFIAFYAGAMTVFFHEISEWDDYHPEVEVYQDYEQAQWLIEQVLEADPGAADDFHLHLSESHGHGHEIFWFKQTDEGTFENYGYTLDDNDKLQDIEQSNARLGRFLHQLHYNAGLPDSWGLYVLGIVALIYALAMATGLLIFIPGFFRDLLIIRPPKNLKRFWLDTHNVVGVISLPWHFMYAWSSVILAIGIFLLAPFQFLVFDGNLLEIVSDDLGQAPPRPAANQPAAMLPVDNLIAMAKEQLPGLTPSELEYHHAGDENGTTLVSGTLEEGNTLTANASVTVSTATGELVSINDPREASAGSTMFFGLYALHFVSFGGYTAKWAYFFLGLAGAYLFYSGNLLWVESRRKRRQTLQRKDAVFLARLNSGVCIGCMAGVSAAFLTSRVTMELANRPELTEYAYYAVFFAAIAWCFIRSVANGTRDVLYACAALTAAIPVVDAIGINRPIWSSVGDGEWPLVSVSILALIGAIAFWRMGHGVHQRAIHGDPNSVWAASKRAGAACVSEPDPQSGIQTV
ncbi:MAG: PepSY-associated TM helix domain-containing protein [Pseudomonadota bacterium]